MNALLRTGLKIGSGIFRAAGMKPSAFAGIICSFPHKTTEISSQEVAQATEVLQTVCPDHGGSCIAAGKEAACDYDLQIIIPAYNVEKYVERCMESAIAAQAAGRHTILITVVDDGSTDGTAAIVDKYRGRPGIEIIHQENRGFSGARNRALENIRGRYITFLDSDDEFGDINSLLDEALKADADIAEGSYEQFNDRHSRYVRCGNVDSDRGGYGILYGYPWGKVYKSELFRNVRFPENYWFEDTVCAMVLYHLAQKVITRDIPCYRYRINPKGISKSSKGRAKSCDSHWITARLMQDREALGMDNSGSEAALMLVRQIRKNYSRIFRIPHKGIEKALFIASCAMYRRYFDGNALPGNMIADALSTGDYLKFRIACVLNLE